MDAYLGKRHDEPEATEEKGEARGEEKGREE